MPAPRLLCNWSPAKGLVYGLESACPDAVISKPASALRALREAEMKSSVSTQSSLACQRPPLKGQRPRVALLHQCCQFVNRTDKLLPLSCKRGRRGSSFFSPLTRKFQNYGSQILALTVASASGFVLPPSWCSYPDPSVLCHGAVLKSQLPRARAFRVLLSAVSKCLEQCLTHVGGGAKNVC